MAAVFGAGVTIATERFEREEGRVGNILNTLVDDNQKIAVVGSEREVL